MDFGCTSRTSVSTISLNGKHERSRKDPVQQVPGTEACSEHQSLPTILPQSFMGYYSANVFPILLDHFHTDVAGIDCDPVSSSHASRKDQTLDLCARVEARGPP
nr:hypothetical protein CFP56_21676 [Quercus suber]